MTDLIKKAIEEEKVFMDKIGQAWIDSNNSHLTHEIPFKAGFAKGWDCGMDYANSELLAAQVRIRQLEKALRDIIKPIEDDYNAQCTDADWYNNNMPGVGLTLDFQSRPPRPKALDIALKALNNGK